MAVMPLQAGSTHQIIAANIAELIRAGHTPEQAAAIAYEHAGTSNADANSRASRYFTAADLSENISMTPEGFLICKDVPIARAGELSYHPSETPITPGVGPTIITRSLEDIQNPLTLASFEGMAITVEHPADGEFVTPQTWNDLAVGTVINVRAGTGDDADKMMSDLLVMEAEAIAAVRSKQLRQVSCGYEAEFIEESPGRGRQVNIRGNHVALVPQGRCGAECAIFDHAQPKENMSMKTLKEKAIAVLAKIFDDEPSTDAGTLSADEAVALRAAKEKEEAAQREQADKEKADAAAAKVGDANAEPWKASFDAMSKRMDAFDVWMKKSEQKVEQGTGDAGPAMCEDADTIARAEILAPGIIKTADVKRKALDAAVASDAGKSVIESLLNGRAFDSVDEDQLFVAASEVMRLSRNASQVTKIGDQQVGSPADGRMTPEKINEINAQHYKR